MVAPCPFVHTYSYIAAIAPYREPTGIQQKDELDVLLSIHRLRIHTGQTQVPFDNMTVYPRYINKRYTQVPTEAVPSRESHRHLTRLDEPVVICHHLYFHTFPNAKYDRPSLCQYHLYVVTP